MIRTGHQIQGDIYNFLRESNLKEFISGDVYRNGYRPRDSKLEDAIVKFSTGLADQIQTGIVTVNIYVPDIDPYSNGIFVENGNRTGRIEELAQEWVDSLTAGKSNYKFKLNQTIYTEEEPETNQHFVVVKLRYEYFDE